MNQFKLVFICRKTEKKVFGKRLTDSLYRIYNPENSEISTVSKFKLTKEYRSSAGNKKLRTKRTVA